MLLTPGIHKNVSLVKVTKDTYENGNPYLNLEFTQGGAKELDFADLLNSGQGETKNTNVTIQAVSRFFNGEVRTQYESDKEVTTEDTLKSFFNLNSLIRHIAAAYLKDEQIKLADITKVAVQAALPTAKLDSNSLKSVFEKSELTDKFMDKYFEKVADLFTEHQDKISSTPVQLKLHRKSTVNNYPCFRLMNYGIAANAMIVPMEAGIDLVETALEIKYNWTNPAAPTLESQGSGGNPEDLKAINETFKI